MKTRKLIIAICVVFASSMWASSIPKQKNSEYGDAPMPLTTVCLDDSGVALSSCSGVPAIIEQSFLSSSSPNNWVWDFQFETLNSFNLKLSGETFDAAGYFYLDPLAADTDNPLNPSCSDIEAAPGSFTEPSGAVTVFGDELAVHCGVAPTGQSTVNMTSEYTSFNVPQNGDGLVLFVATSDPSQTSFSPLSASAGLSIGPATEVPEPGSLVLLASVLLVCATMGLFSRRRTARMRVKRNNVFNLLLWGRLMPTGAPRLSRD